MVCSSSYIYCKILIGALCRWFVRVCRGISLIVWFLVVILYRLSGSILSKNSPPFYCAEALVRGVNDSFICWKSTIKPLF